MAEEGTSLEAVDFKTATRSRASSAPSKDWNFSTGIKLFHSGREHPAPFAATGVLPMPPGNLVPGHVCQAARALLGVSQAWLWEQTKVSKKTINDFENGFVTPKGTLILRIRQALEDAGAQFVLGEDVIGVVVYSSRSEGGPRPRSDKLRGNDDVGR